MRAFADEVSAEELKEAVHKEGEQHAPKLRLHKVQRPSSWRLGAALGRAEGRAQNAAYAVEVQRLVDPGGQGAVALLKDARLDLVRVAQEDVVGDAPVLVREPLQYERARTGLRVRWSENEDRAGMGRRRQRRRRKVLARRG